jgi:outer membrane protein assembly factor BamB
MSKIAPGLPAYEQIAQLVFVGFNSRVVALDRDSGQIVWEWTCPKGRGFVAILLDGDRLIASVQGYTYCLDPLSGEQRWTNPLPGMGLGVPCLASVRGTTSPVLYAMLAEQQQQEESEAATHSSTTAAHS